MEGEGEGLEDNDEGNEDLDGRGQEQADEGFFCFILYIWVIQQEFLYFIYVQNICCS